MMEKFKLLHGSILNSPAEVDDVHLFYIDETFSCFLKNYRLEAESLRTELVSIKSLGFDRGEILSLFSQLEFIVNEFLRIHFFGFGSNKDFDVLLEGLDLNTRLKALVKFEIISSSLRKKITNASFVRNQMAHEWKLDNVLYLQKELQDEDNFKRFRDDMVFIFRKVIECYQIQMEKNQFDDHLDQLITKYQITES